MSIQVVCDTIILDGIPVAHMTKSWPSHSARFADMIDGNSEPTIDRLTRADTENARLEEAVTDLEQKLLEANTKIDEQAAMLKRYSNALNQIIELANET